MKKKRLEGVLLAFAVAVSTVFAPVNVAAADSAESKSVTLQDSAKDQNGKPTEKPGKYVLKDKKNKAAGVRTRAAGVDSMTYDWDDTTQTLTVSGTGKVVGNYDTSYPLSAYKNKARKIILQDGITEIGTQAFANFSNLTEVDFPSTLKKIGEAAFYGCSELTSAELPGALTTLSTAAFADCSAFADLVLPKKLQQIGDYAFQNCALTQMTFPASVNYISSLAFYGCSGLQGFQVAAGNAKYSASEGVLFEAKKTTLVLYPMGKQAESYQIPGSVKTIGENAFNNANVSEILIPKTVSAINEGAFAGAKIKTLNLPGSITSLGLYLCENCTELQSVTIGKGIKSLSYRMFYKCSSLTEVSLGSTLNTLDSLTFAYCTSLQKITIPDNVTQILNGCFGECSALEKIIFPKKLKEIAFQAFLNCGKLTSVTFPSALEKINRVAFYGTGIKKVKIPSSVTYIGPEAFPAGTVMTGISGLAKMDDGSYMKMEKLPVKVKYDYSAAFDVVKRVNSERSKRGLKTLTMDKRMIKGSMFRAAELAIAFSHTRPSGRDFNTVCYDSKQGYIIMGENIAAGQTSSKSAMTSWMNSQGHKENILTSAYTGIGVGAVVVNGMHYWVQNFSTSTVQKASASSYKNKSANVNVKVTKEQDGNLFYINPLYSFSMKKGTSRSISYSIYNGFVNVPLVAGGMKYTVYTPSVCKVSASGKVTGLKAGKTKIKVAPQAAPSLAKTFTVTVKGSSLAKVSWGKCRRSSKTVLLQWKKVKGATAYEIYRYKNKKWVKVTTTGKTSYKYKNPPKNGSYKVRALKKSGNKKIYGSFSAVKKIR